MLLASGLAAMIVTDAIYMRQNLIRTYVAGSLVDNGWIIGYILIGLAGVSQANSVFNACSRLNEDYLHGYGLADLASISAVYLCHLRLYVADLEQKSYYWAII